MDDTRKLLISVAASIARLQLRVWRQNQTSRTLPNGDRQPEPRWKVSELDPPSPWFEGCPNQFGLDALEHWILETQIYVLAAIDAPDPIDTRTVMRAIHHMCGDPGMWTTAEKRLAAKLGIELSEAPVLMFNYAGLSCFNVPGTGRALR